MEAVDYKCPSCSAHLHFDPKSQGWNCDYCGSKFNLSELESNIEKFKKKEVPKIKKNSEFFDENMSVYNCPNCGASIISDENTSATFCVYCKSTSILKDRLTGVFAPSLIIPFKNTKEDAINAFKKVCHGKPLMPKEFKDPKNIQEITGIYIPFWLFDCISNGSIDVRATKVSTWYMGDYLYTKTDTYQVKRGGEFTFNAIPVDGSIRFADEIMNSIEPFDYKGLLEFNHSYLSGFLSEKYDVIEYNAYKSAKERAEETINKELFDSIKGYRSKIINSKSFSTNKSRSDYVLLPVWMLNIKYNEKMYTFAMNGQTGKMIGNIPYSKKKAVICFILIFVISLLILMFITYMV